MTLLPTCANGSPTRRSHTRTSPGTRQRWLSTQKHQNPPECVRLDAERRKRQAYQECSTLPAATLVFDVPKNLVRILDRDLRFAGIPKTDDRGRTVDVHALRHSFGTHLSCAGVHPRTAQAAMRHSKIDLAMNTYTDPRLLDVAGAVELLPDLPLDSGDKTDARTAVKATGTDGGMVQASPQLPPMLPIPAENSCKTLVIAGQLSSDGDGAKNDENPCILRENTGSVGFSKR